MPLKDNALTTLNETKDQLGITGTEQNAIIENFINAAADMTELITRRKLKFDENPDSKPGVYTPILTPSQSLIDGNGRDRLFLPEWPIRSIQLIRTRDVAFGSWVELTAEDYYYKSDEGYIVVGNIVQPTSSVWPLGRQTVEVTWKAGYTMDEIPATIRQFQWDFVQWRLASRKRDPGKSSENLSGVYSYTMKSGDAIDEETGLPKSMVTSVRAFARGLF